MLRRCFREPIRDIFDAAALLDAAANAHLAGDSQQADNLIVLADQPTIAEWTESIWGKRNAGVHVFVVPSSPLPHLPVAKRPQPRMPSLSTKAAILERDGFHCRFCGIPVIPAEVRHLLNRIYPSAARWGRRNVDQHAALQCMWLQWDHLVPNERGGSSDLENVAVTCAPCNFGRMQWTLEEADLINPLTVRPAPSWAGYERWDGLTRLLR